jgi:RNA polymerase sigma factor (sigma-70 family)
MHSTNRLPMGSCRRQLLAAVLVGTALSALTTTAEVQGQAPDATAQAVAALSRYCTVCWRNARLHPDCWADCTQEVLARLLERVELESWGRLLTSDSPQRDELVRAIDTVKKRFQRARRFHNHVELLADRRESDRRRLNHERQAVREAAEQHLSPRQQRILRFSFEGWSVQDIARELDLPAERVSDEKYKAIRKLRQHLCATDVA